ncbi:MAG: MBL fold metallo-hydrolase [Betaproteobacteria bacterium]|nr:MBL fold metallo-hydrolase [Betaproteobacteria bacterium]
MRFASLGSGSKGNCLVAEAGGSRVLIDCGLAPKEAGRRLARLGLEPGDIDAILVTHEHDDHAGYAHAFAARCGASVWMTHGTMRALQEARKSSEGVEPRVIEGRGAFAIGAIEVLPFTVPHDAREPVQYVLSDGARRLGVLTDLGTSTAHVEATLSGCDALVLETNHEPDLLRGGSYPKWLKDRIGGPFGHLSNPAAARLLASLDRSRLQHLICAHLSQQNNRPDLARAALAGSLGCAEEWVGLATQDEGFGWRDLR